VKFSIVTISYNQGRFLDRAIRSVIGQTGVDLEYIVVDPGSTDGSRRIIEHHAKQIAMVLLDGDEGPADGLNKGFAVATGDVFGFINADDAYLADALSEASETFAEHPAASVVCGDGIVVNADGRVLRIGRSSTIGRRRSAYRISTIFQPSLFIRAEAFRAVGGFNAENSTCWDGELLVDLALAGYASVHSYRLWSAFTLHDQSISGTGRLEAQFERDRLRLFSKAMGRNPTVLDRCIIRSARPIRWVMSPLSLLYRIRDRGVQAHISLVDTPSGLLLDAE
jgi:glycosyltransferase involved in cell wall biosynthesis